MQARGTPVIIKSGTVMNKAGQEFSNQTIFFSEKAASSFPKICLELHQLQKNFTEKILLRFRLAFCFKMAP